jgi:hypothetical protein
LLVLKGKSPPACILTRDGPTVARRAECGATNAGAAARAPVAQCPAPAGLSALKGAGTLGAAAGVAETADASDLEGLSTGAGNPPREFSRTRGNLSTSGWWQSRAKLRAAPPELSCPEGRACAGRREEGVETWRLRPTADTHGQGKVQTTNRKGSESYRGMKIRWWVTTVRVRVPPPALPFPVEQRLTITDDGTRRAGAFALPR